MLKMIDSLTEINRQTSIGYETSSSPYFSEKKLCLLDVIEDSMCMNPYVYIDNDCVITEDQKVDKFNIKNKLLSITKGTLNLHILSRREITILKMYIGEGYTNSKSIETIAEYYRMSIERVKQIKKGAIGKLKKFYGPEFNDYVLIEDDIYSECNDAQKKTIKRFENYTDKYLGV